MLVGQARLLLHHSQLRLNEMLWRWLLSEASVGVHHGPLVAWSCWHHLTKARLVHHPPLSDEGILHQDRLWLWRRRRRRRGMVMARLSQASSSSGVLEDCTEAAEHVLWQSLLAG